jgi:hypothetical protein
MDNFQPTNPDEGVAGISRPRVAAGWVPSAKHARRRRARRFLAYRKSGRIAAATMICVAVGLPLAAASPSASASQLLASSAASTGASNAPSAPAQGGA